MNERSMILQGAQAAFRHKTLLIVMAVTILSITAAYTAFVPRQYASDMQIVVQDSREKPLEAADKSTGVGNANSSEELIESRVNSEMELLSGSDIMEQAVAFRMQAMGLAAPQPGSREMAKMVEKMNAHIKLTPVRKTSVLEVSYQDTSPDVAQKVLGEVQHLYLNKHLRVLRPEGTLKLFVDRETDFNNRLMSTQQQLVDFQLANHIVSIPEETDDLGKQLSTVRGFILEEQATAAGASAQLASLHGLMSAPATASSTHPVVEERVQTSSKVSSNYYATQQVSATLVDLQNKRLQLLTRFQPKDKLVLEVDQQIANTNLALDKMKQDTNLETDTDINPVWNQLQQQLHGNEVAASGSKAKLVALRAEESAILARLAQLQHVTVENDRLARALEELRDSEKLYADKSEHERLEDVLDHDRVGNVAVAMEPTFSAYPVSPHVLLNLVLGFITALVACIAALVLLESNRSDVLTPDELESASGLRVLSTVPEFGQRFTA